MTTPTLPSSNTSFAALNESLIGEIELEEEQYINSLPESVLPVRNNFIQHWNSLINLSKDLGEKTSTRRLTRSDFLAKKKDITSQVYNALKKYTYELYKKDLGGPQYLTGESKDTVVDELGAYIVQLKGDPLIYNSLLQNIKTAHSKEVDFRNKAFKVFKRELLFKQLSLENYNNNLEQQLITQKAQGEKEVDRVRRDFSKKVADCLLDNARLKSEVDALTESNLKQAARIAELNNIVDEQPVKGEEKSFFSEYETVKTNLEQAEKELSSKEEFITNLKDSFTQLENDSKEKIRQIVDSYNTLSIKHDSLQSACTIASSEIVDLKDKNSQLAAQVDKIINENLANTTDLADQNVQLTNQLTKLRQTDAKNQATIKTLKQNNQTLTEDLGNLHQQLKQQTDQLAQIANMAPTPPSKQQQQEQQHPQQQQQQQPRAPSPDNTPVTKSHLRE